ncbi:predicted protein [Histoplasma capsulatum G186AR]|uniref:Uncharacterized protein n=1 Tax=Ajellomyces capsulatus (strain G186AR / H82 / ATCC MYA-2454 / RMSCC 2432) TaxID=447093 RepID=C0NE48_AJECG|nr:uncharacterized protein HCBG_02141 [Histoplasma capsulatum G186AR]EEH10496.1 predicted protein [Histoplasma capsulatum G186AR]
MSLWADIATIQVALDVANSPRDGGELKAVRPPPSPKKVCSTSDNSPQLLSSSYPTTTSILLDPTSTLRPARSVAVYHPISSFPVSTFWPFKLAGLNYTNFSFIHPLLGPKFRVFSGGDTRPP